MTSFIATTPLRVSSHHWPAVTPHRRVRWTAKRNPLQVARDAQTVYTRDKPAWCQPWTIVGTGSTLITGVWLLPHGLLRFLVALPLTTGVLAWWYIFLVVYPTTVLESKD